MTDARLEEDLDPASWQALAMRCPGATFFHLPAWYAATGHRGAAALFTYGDGQQALLPLALHPRFRGSMRQALAGVEGGYGGLLSPEPLDPARIAAAYALVLRRYPDLRVTGNPFAPRAALPAAGRRTADTTRAVPLGAGDPLERMARSQIKQVRRGQRQGYRLEIVEAPDEAALAGIYPLYAAHAAGWESERWVRDEAYFQALARAGGPALVLFRLTREGHLAAFRLVARVGPLVVALHGVRERGPDHLNAGPTLAATSMAWLQAHGVSWLDLMPSGALAGIEAYKASQGALALPFEVASHASGWGGLLERAWRWRQAVITASPASRAMASSSGR